jgi:diguanylate cyclase (GGDEF)-like protein/PAS domain S-box-containing protein
VASRSSDAIVVCEEADGDIGVVWANDAYLTLLGAGRGDVPAGSAGAFRQPDLMARVQRGDVVVERLDLPRVDGSVVPVEVTYYAVSKPTRGRWYVASHRDRSTEVQAAAALQRSEEWSRALVDNLSDVLAVVDAGSIVRWVSPSMVDQLGYSTRELIGQSAWSLVHTDDLEQAAADWADVANGLPGPPSRYRIRHADGSWRTMHVTGSPQFDHPDIKGMIITLSDVTERAMAEALLEEQAGLLESIARGAPLEVSLQRVVRMIDRTLEGVCSSVGTLEVDGVIRTRATLSVPRPVVQLLDDAPPTAAPSLALRRASEDFVEYDMTTIEELGDVRSTFARHGIVSCRSAPIRVQGGGDLLGALTIFHREGFAPDPFESALLRRAVDIAAIAVERHRFEVTIEYHARHDPLTGLANRVLLLERIAEGLERSTRLASGLAVFLLDIDRFKVINDSVGHAHGDKLLREVAERFASTLRAGDTLGRFGGDEFMLVCPRVADEETASEIADRFVAALDEPFVLGDGEVHLSASVGIALGLDAAIIPEALIRDADVAMYRAKAQGRNQHVVFQELVDHHALEQLALEQALHSAVERGEFELHFQPVVQLADGCMTHVEALLRWHRPGHGMVFPGSFITLAEETGLIVPMGWWVLEQACAHAAAWPELPMGGRVQVAVNLSPHQLAEPDLLDVVASALQRHAIEPERLCFEVTESALVHDIEGVKSALSGLKSLGVHIAIDDFGTGYATLDYVRHFSMADYLKIDRSFVGGVERAGSGEAAIVGAAIALAKNLGFTVVAEGVETLFQMEALRQLDCDLAQGFLFSRPVPLDDAIELLAAQGGTIQA